MRVGTGHEVVLQRPGDRRALLPRRLRGARPRDASSSPAPARDRARAPPTAATPSGTRPASPTPPSRRCRPRSTRAGRPTTGSTPRSSTTPTSSASIRDGLRANGVRTVGRFVWEHFSDDDVEPAQEAFDVIYSMTDAEHAALRDDGHRGRARALRDPPRAARARAAARPRADHARVARAASWAGASRIDEAIEALGRVDDPRLRLLLRGQVKRKAGKLEKAAEARPADRDPARGPAHRRAPPVVRGRRRLPDPVALGGAGAAALRGDGGRDADPDQRRPADERGRHGRAQRPALRVASRRDDALGPRRQVARRRATWRARSRRSPTTSCARGCRPARSRCASELAWSRTVEDLRDAAGDRATR